MMLKPRTPESPNIEDDSRNTKMGRRQWRSRNVSIAIDIHILIITIIIVIFTEWLRLCRRPLLWILVSCVPRRCLMLSCSSMPDAGWVPLKRTADLRPGAPEARREELLLLLGGRIRYVSNICHISVI